MIRSQYLDEYQQRFAQHAPQEIIEMARRAPSNYFYNRFGMLMPVPTHPITALFFQNWEILPFVPEGERATFKHTLPDPAGVIHKIGYGQMTYVGDQEIPAYSLDAVNALIMEHHFGNCKYAMFDWMSNRKLCKETAMKYVASDISDLILGQGISINARGHLHVLDNQEVALEYVEASIWLSAQRQKQLQLQAGGRKIIENKIDLHMERCGLYEVKGND